MKKFIKKYIEDTVIGTDKTYYRKHYLTLIDIIFGIIYLPVYIIINIIKFIFLIHIISLKD